jgi:hypothetical protein
MMPLLFQYVGVDAGIEPETVAMFALAVLLWIRMLMFWIVIAFGNCRKLA